MPTPIWPVSLPQSPRVSGFKEQLPETVLRTSMDAGPVKSRRRFTTGPTPVTIELYLTRAQVAILDEFFNDTCEGGALSFDWVNHRTKAPARYRFTSEPALTPQAASDTDGKIWSVSFSAEFLPISTEPDPDPGEGDAPPPPPIMVGFLDEPPTLDGVLAYDPLPDNGEGWPDPPTTIPFGMDPVIVGSSGDAGGGVIIGDFISIPAAPTGPTSPGAIVAPAAPTSVSADTV